MQDNIRAEKKSLVQTLYQPVWLAWISRPNPSLRGGLCSVLRGLLNAVDDIDHCNFLNSTTPINRLRRRLNLSKAVHYIFKRNATTSVNSVNLDALTYYGVCEFIIFSYLIGIYSANLLDFNTPVVLYLHKRGENKRNIVR